MPKDADPLVTALLDRLSQVGGMAWVWRGKLRLRPLAAIPEDLMTEIMANEAAVTAVVAKRPKRARDRTTTPEKRFMVRLRKELNASIQGTPTPAQKSIIDRMVWLSWHVRCFDAKALAAGALSSHDSKQYLAYSNSLERCTMRLEELRVAARKQAKQDAAGVHWPSLGADA